MTIRLLLFLLCVVVPRPAQADTNATTFRVFLTDGTALVSYGEYVRVNDEVIFSMPVGGSASEPRLQIVTLPVAAVDWTRTDRYAETARYQQYVNTRAEDDFRVLSDEVARTLNDIALSTDRQRALTEAERVRRALADWPQAHYGYRQDDVRDILGLLDEAINGLRAAAGASRFELALVAASPPVNHEPLLAPPTARQQIEQLIRLANMSPRAVDKVSLLQSALVALHEPGTGYSPVETTALGRYLEERLKAEAAIDARYAKLSQEYVQSARRLAASANVADLERLLQRLTTSDERLGGKRPDSVQAIRASVEAELDAARQLRLLRDQWSIRRSLYRDYQRSVSASLLQLVKAEPWLDQIRRLDGPTPERLLSLRARFTGGSERLRRQQVPESVASIHDVLVAAWRFAENAVNGRYAAVSSGNLTTAWEASSAAAGAVMMLRRVQADLRGLLEKPQLTR